MFFYGVYQRRLSIVIVFSRSSSLLEDAVPVLHFQSWRESCHNGGAAFRDLTCLFFPAISQSLTESKVSALLIYFRNNRQQCVTSQHVPKFEFTLLYSAVLLRLYSELMQMLHFPTLKNGEKYMYVRRHLMNKFIPTLAASACRASDVCVMLFVLQADTDVALMHWWLCETQLELSHPLAAAFNGFTQ